MKHLPLFLLIVSCGLPAFGQFQSQTRRGPRQPLDRQSLFSRGQSAGSVGEAARAATEGQRFSRGSRDVRSFVGSDRADVTTFVGSEQGRTQGNVQSSVTGLREQPAVQVNQPRTFPTTGPYPARIVLAPELRLNAGPTVRLAGPSPQRRLGQFFAAQSTSVTVTGSNRSVTLSGQVGSAREGRIVGLIASFEPGVDRVRNDLRIAGGPPAGLSLPVAPARSIVVPRFGSGR